MTEFSNDNDRHPTSEARGIVIALCVMAAICMTMAVFAGFNRMRDQGVASIPQRVEAQP